MRVTRMVLVQLTMVLVTLGDAHQYVQVDYTEREHTYSYGKQKHNEYEEKKRTHDRHGVQDKHVGSYGYEERQAVTYGKGKRFLGKHDNKYDRHGGKFNYFGAYGHEEERKAAYGKRMHNLGNRDAKTHYHDRRTFTQQSTNNQFHDYEVWASDQSNSAPGAASNGVIGGFLWIWDKESIHRQLADKADAVPLPCTHFEDEGPCNLLDIFPPTLAEYDMDGLYTGNLLGHLEGFGRLHGVIKDPLNRYVVVSMFAPGGGYVGIMDTRTKEAVGLFRVTEVCYAAASGMTCQRSVHMSFWTADGSAIIIANLHGKTLERIKVTRGQHGDILSFSFDTDASIGFGRNMNVAKKATFFRGSNACKSGGGGQLLPSGISGNYANADFGDLTPSGVCKENGCTSGNDGDAGGRTNNLVICPIPSSRDNGYVTLAGGGLFVIDLKSTPMRIKAEYGRGVVYGAGCAVVEAEDHVFVDAGVSASAVGFDQSMFAVFSFDDTKFDVYNGQQNLPMPIRVYQSAGNTMSGGNVEGDKETDLTGQLPGVTTRRDAHGAAPTIDGRYVHVADRIQNRVDVFDTQSLTRSSYNLFTRNGDGDGQSPTGPCFTRSVLDDGQLPLNDPAPDLLELTPDGKYFMVAFRGPAPVTVAHASQGSCPGVGVIQIIDGGKSGKLVGVLRATNTLDDNANFVVPGGVQYTGAERSDVHGAIVVFK